MNLSLKVKQVLIRTKVKIKSDRLDRNITYYILHIIILLHIIYYILS